ncbi:beta-carotene isomerase D27, chloroplastic-like [Aristolochia californica]|uniref:beta-carotene isomerase D27, chloroplastic-like n=1 Tax=Aristolochia californica TaxID=171875 RepID=UPI0035DBE5E4
MEATVFNNGGVLTIAAGSRKSHDVKRLQRVQAVMSKPKEKAELQATVYDDGWFSRTAIRHLSQSVQATTGISSSKEGYESFLEVTSLMWRNIKTTDQQHELVLKALQKAFPNYILSLIRRLLPPSKATREFFAIFTTLFFYWLVGPSEVKALEVDGKTERSLVHIKKCRFLVGSNCVGMCTNLCKIPSQKFLKDSFGIPVTMVPNFEDMSCEMKFGVEPPAAEDDPAMKQPCYSFCKLKRRHNKECSNI